MLFEATKFMILCHNGNRILTHVSNTAFFPISVTTKKKRKKIFLKCPLWHILLCPSNSYRHCLSSPQSPPIWANMNFQQFSTLQTFIPPTQPSYPGSPRYSLSNLKLILLPLCLHSLMVSKMSTE